MPKRPYNAGYGPKKKATKGEYYGHVRQMAQVPVPMSAVYQSSYRSAQPYAGRSEIKWFDTTVAATTLSSAGTVVQNSLNLLTAGTGESQLIGRKCHVKSIFIRGQFSKPALSNATLTNVAADDFCRMMLVLDRQPNGGAATVNQVLENVDIRGMNNLNYSRRFKILKDFTMRMDDVVNHDGTNYFTGTQVRELEPIYKKLNFPIEFGPTPSGSIGDVLTNNLFVIAFSNTGQSLLQFRARLRYSDA